MSRVKVLLILLVLISTLICFVRNDALIAALLLLNVLILLFYLLARWRPQNTSSKYFRNILFILLSLPTVLDLILGGSIFLWGYPFGIKTPSDEKLITLFHQHRAEFEKLREMVIEDGRQVHIGNGVVFGNGSSPQRSREYEEQLIKIAPKLTLDVTTENKTLEVHFGFAYGDFTGFAPPCWEKGIEYLSNVNDMKAKMSLNLDKVDDLDGENLRQIEPNWFIFYGVY